VSPRLTVILDNLRSSHNVGSIFRTADAIGVEHIYLCGTTPGPLDRFGRANSRLSKVSLGAEKSIKWEHCDSTMEIIEKLKKDNWQIVALETSKEATNIVDFNVSAKQIALTLGSEPDGINSEVLLASDSIVTLPMHGKKSSLNVAVAFGVAAYGLHWLGR